MVLALVKSVGIMVVTLLVIVLVMMFTGDRYKATGLVVWRDQSTMFLILGVLYLALGVFLRTSPLLK